MIDPFSFRTRPFAHQAEELLRSAELRSHALFWEQGTGKSKYGADVTAHNRREGRLAAAVIVAHNHPSGDPSPSRQDIEVTQQLRDTGTLVGITLLDHIVFASEGYVSFAEEYWR